MTHPQPLRTGLRADEPAADRPRVLFLCQTLPFPPDGGVNIRSFHTLRLLAGHYAVHALCFWRRASRPSEASVRAGLEGLSAYAPSEAFPIPQEHARGRLLWDHARSVLLRRSYTVFAYESVAFRARLRALLREHDFAAVHMDSLDLSVYLPSLRSLPVVCGHHNVESALLARRAEAEPSRVRRAYLRLQSRLQEKEERTAAPSVALNLVCSGEDRAELARIAPGARIAVVPNGVDTGQFQPATGGSEGIVFVGGVSWFPNADGMRWFMDSVLPLVRRELPDVPVTWVGRASDQIAAEYRERHEVTLTGYVEDIRPYVARAGCFVAPIRVGGGTRLKILDAWAMGKAVVSTSVGCEGLDARDGENILVRNDPGDFAAAVVRVLRDAGMRRALGSAARETAVTLYDWGVIGHGMIEEYRRVLATRRAG